MRADPLSTLHANLDALAPVARRAVEAANADGVVQIHAAAAQISASIRTPDGRWVHLHSERAPMAEAERSLDRVLPDGPPSVVIVIGPGLGYILEAIERRGAATRIIAIEPFAPVARALLERRDWRDWIQSKRLTILIGPEYLDASDAWRRVDVRAGPPPIIEHPVLTREFPAEIARARDIAGRIVQGAQSNDDARKRFAGRYLLNTLGNLPAIVAEGDVAALADVFAGTPAIVVGAGPSLDDNLESLQAIAGRAVIIAVDTTLRPLLAAGIRPHLVVALDPSELNATNLLGIADTEGSWLVSEGSIDPRVFPEFAGRAFTFKISDHHPWPWLRAHGSDRGTLRAWGSVLTSAFDLACHMGCDPMVFAGADLAYTNELLYCRNTIFEGDRAHLTGVAERAEAFREGLRLRKTCKAPDLRGIPVLTTPLLVQFRDWLVSRSEALDQRRILNATGAGILHGGRITQIDLASLPLTGPDLDLAVRLAAVWRESSTQSLRAWPNLEDAIGRADRDIFPMKPWLDFAGDSASRDEITACIERTWRTPPVITVPPANAFWEPGCTVSFTAAASGGPTPAVQWQVSTDGGSSWADIIDATAPTCAATIDAADAGKQFRAVFTNSGGSATTPAASITAAISGLVHDFNGDGKPDILWRHPTTGANVVWCMRGVARTGLDVFPLVADLAWVLGGACDFNGDGKPDILWRHSVSGENVLWHMDGATLASHSVLPLEADLAWTIVGVGDFNGDGKPDILWRNIVTGANRVWYMDGSSRTGLSELIAEADLAWAIVGTGDFSGDGKPDILWRNIVTGANRIWYMNGSSRTGLGRLDPEADLAWTVVGVGDFNGDGQPDILWRNTMTGSDIVWYMDGVVRTGSAALDAVLEPDRT
jgi:6-hydroxymethylpterin diphosphokinase MptE-like protein/VCBS repeat protein